MKQTPFCIKREPSQLSKAERGNWREGRGGGDKPVLETIKILKRKESSSFRSALRMLGD